MKKYLVAVLSFVFLVSLFAASSWAAPKTLVAFFSNSGNTQHVAEVIADCTGADVYRIIAADPYVPDRDLSASAKRDPNSRVSLEDKDETARPALGGDPLPNVADYDVIFIGHPIWFGNAPKIIRTFLESLDLSGKSVVTFCTSGSSEIDESSQKLRSSLPEGATLVIGRSFRRADRVDVAKWINGLGLGYDVK